MGVLHEASVAQGSEYFGRDDEPCLEGKSNPRYQRYLDLLDNLRRSDTPAHGRAIPSGILSYVSVPACVLECRHEAQSCHVLSAAGMPDTMYVEALEAPEALAASCVLLWEVAIPRLIMITPEDMSHLAATGRRLRYEAFWVWPLRCEPDSEGCKQFMCSFVDDVTHLSDGDIWTMEQLATEMVMAMHGLRQSQQADLLRQERLRSETLALELQQSVRTKDSFMNLAAHELRTPLSALMLQADSAARLLGQDPVNTERLNHKVNAILKQVERLRNLVEDLLDVSRAEQGKFVLRREAVDVAGLTHKVIERLESSFARAHCQLHAHIEGPVEGIFDAMRLDQVISNLMVNALKYGLSKPVSISVCRRGQQAIIVVADQGIGIAPAQHHIIFERYGRAVSERDYGGLGLGLWISQQIVVALGGTIDLTSALGEGATFTVSLPLESK